MNNTRAIVMLLIALIAGTGAAIMASRWLIDKSSTQLNKIAVASVDINPGEKLTPEMFSMLNWPASSVPPNSFNESAKLSNRVLKTSLQRGEPIVESKLAPVGTLGGLSAVIAEGKRAITVRVNDVIGVAGFALPGNYVDIIVNTQKESDKKDSNEQDISKIVLKRILVLAIAQELGQDQTKAKVVNAVTLEVSPEQAEAIDLARSVGTLSLVLRNQIDQNLSATTGITKETLLNPLPEPAVAAVTAPAPVKPKVIKKNVVKVGSVVPVAAKHCTRVITGLSETLECF